jgi:hypothetical protein
MGVLNNAEQAVARETVSLAGCPSLGLQTLESKGASYYDGRRDVQRSTMIVNYDARSSRRDDDLASRRETLATVDSRLDEKGSAAPLYWSIEGLGSSTKNV